MHPSGKENTQLVSTMQSRKEFLYEKIMFVELQEMRPIKKSELQEM